MRVCSFAMLICLSRFAQMKMLVSKASKCGTMLRMANEELLSIYLNDHLAASLAGYEVAKRSRSSNEGTPFEEFLAGLVVEIELDREALENIMDRLGIRRNPAKQAGAWLF